MYKTGLPVGLRYLPGASACTCSQGWPVGARILFYTASQSFFVKNFVKSTHVQPVLPGYPLVPSDHAVHEVVVVEGEGGGGAAPVGEASLGLVLQVRQHLLPAQATGGHDHLGRFS